MYEISNLRARVEYLNSSVQNRDVILTNTEFNENYLNVKEYIEVCKKLNEEYKFAYEDRYGDKINEILETTLSEKDRQMIQAKILNYQSNSFTIHYDFILLKNIIDQIISEEYKTQEFSFVIPQILMKIINSAIEVDIKNQIIVIKSDYSIDKIDEYILGEFTNTTTKKISDYQYHIQLINSVWGFKRFIKGKAYFKDIEPIKKRISFEEELLKTMLSLVAKPDFLNDVVKRHKEEMLRIANILSNRMSNYVNRDFVIQMSNE